MSRTLGDIEEPPLIDRIADELYGLPPARFVTARDAHVRACADRALAKEIAALRKPTLSAWALNRLARQAPEDLAAAAALGEELRSAQEELRGGALRELGARRRATLAALVQRTGELAAGGGHPLGPDAVAQVRATLTSALADAVLAARIRAGRLVKPVEQSGFGPLTPGTAPVPDDLAPRRERRRERELGRAREDITEARKGLRDAEEVVTRTARALEEAEDRTAEVRAELRRAQQAEAAAGVEATRARRRADTARDRLAKAERRMSDLRGDA
ncbi:hypothetical protein [Actinosynnema sp. NPDC020468]|uniref:hypothetical protein n=1 Tax=Actinosynnema sp. NPDC020468 TaxID=3154488 RepID=UPI0033EC15F6